MPSVLANVDSNGYLSASNKCRDGWWYSMLVVGFQRLHWPCPVMMRPDAAAPCTCVRIL